MLLKQKKGDRKKNKETKYLKLNRSKKKLKQFWFKTKVKNISFINYQYKPNPRKVYSLKYKTV